MNSRKGSSIRKLSAWIGMIALLAQATVAWYFAAGANAAEIENTRWARRWHELAEARLPPTETNLAALRREHLNLREVEEGLRRGLAESVSAEPLAPRSAADLFFEIAAYIERMRAACDAVGISRDPEECFGFRHYVEANQVSLEEPPGTKAGMEELARIAGQVQHLERLLLVLIDAQPLGILEAERASAGSASRGERRARPPDLFLRPTFDASEDEGIRMTGYRLSFDGRTEVLRRFLLEIDRLKLPVTVRGVKVMPLPKEGPAETRIESGTVFHSGRPLARSPFPLGASRPEKEAADSAEHVPIVEANLSRFFVLMESYELIDVQEEGSGR